jgi:hypothetical protein
MTTTLGKRIRFFAIAAAAIAASSFVAQGSAQASTVILNNTHNYDANGVTDAITINVQVIDQGPTYLWQYTVTNNGFDPVPGSTNGFSGFELALPGGFVADLANQTGPAGWDFNCCSGQPVEWDIDNSAGNGVMPGSTDVFSFTTLPRLITNSTGWFHTWQGDGQTYVTYYTDTAGALGPEAPDLVLPPRETPLPATLPLFASGLGALGLLGWRRKRKAKLVA